MFYRNILDLLLCCTMKWYQEPSHIWTTSQSMVAPLRQVFLLSLSVTSASAFFCISCSFFLAASAILWDLLSSVFLLTASAWSLFQWGWILCLDISWLTFSFNLFWMSREISFLCLHTRFLPFLTLTSCSMAPNLCPPSLIARSRLRHKWRLLWH